MDVTELIRIVIGLLCLWGAYEQGMAGHILVAVLLGIVALLALGWSVIELISDDS